MNKVFLHFKIKIKAIEQTNRINGYVCSLLFMQKMDTILNVIVGAQSAEQSGIRKK